MGASEKTKQSFRRLAKSAWIRCLGIALVALTIVAVIGGLDSRRQLASSQALGLRWARQTAVQAESLALVASSMGERDPLAWAVRLLTQGTDSRIIFVSKYHSDGFQQMSSMGAEEFKFDLHDGVLDYTKVLYPEDAAGIRVKVFVTRNRIFGAKSVLGQDLTFTALFVFCFYFLNLLVLRRLAPAEDGALKTAILDWIGQAKHALVELATHIRDMTLAARKLSSTAIMARKHSALARDAVLAIANERRNSKKDPNELAALAAETEAAFLTADAQMKNLIRKLLQTTISKASQVNAMETRLEQALLNCDQAYDSLKNVSEHAQVMNSEITKTTQGMLEQSQMMKALKQRA